MASPSEFAAELLEHLRRLLENTTILRQSQHHQILASVLERLQTATPEDAIAFVLAGLPIMSENRGPVSLVVNQAAAAVLQNRLPLTEDQAVEMLQLMSVPYHDFPYRGVLDAVAALPMTPRIAEALRRLRPCITDYLGGEARNLHARIDNLLSGPAPDTALAV